MKNDHSDMQSKIKLVAKGVNPDSPSPTASLMKFQGGRLISYGGTFCVSVPCGVDIDCAIAPTTLLNFFRKPREGVTYSEQDGKLRVQHKRERVTIPCLPATDMPIIDILDDPTEVKLFPRKRALKMFMECIDPSNPLPYLQGLLLRNGHAAATDSRFAFAMPSGLPKDIECVLPFDTLKFIAGLDEQVTGVCHGPKFNYLKFTFPSGLTVCSQVISADDYPNIIPVISPKEKGRELVMHEDLLEEIKGLTGDRITVSHSGVGYKDGKSFGDIELKNADERFAFTVDRKRFALMLGLTKDNTIVETKTPQAIHAPRS